MEPTTSYERKGYEIGFEGGFKEAFEEGFKVDLKQGLEEVKKEIAPKLLLEGMSIKKVAELLEKAVEKLRDKQNQTE